MTKSFIVSALIAEQRHSVFLQVFFKTQIYTDLRRFQVAAAWIQELAAGRAFPLIPITVLRPRILITIPADGGTLVGLRVRGFYRGGCACGNALGCGGRASKLGFEVDKN